MAPDIAQLEDKARQLRLAVIEMIGVGKPGHVGGSCSIADLVTALYFHEMKHDPANPKWEERDRFLLSKGHAALAQYAALAACGYFPKEHLSTLKQLGTILQGHPDMLRMPGVEANIKRYKKCTITATDLDGNRFTEEAQDIEIRGFQHEVDHLDGMLIKDRMGQVQLIGARKILRQLQEDFENE